MGILLRHILWICITAARDARGSSRKLIIFVLPLCVGVAVIVAGGSLRYSFDEQITEQARALIGADAALTGKAPISVELKQLLEKFEISSILETRFRAMAGFSSGDNQLVTVRAVGEGFPYIGSLTKDSTVKISGSGTVLVERSLWNPEEDKPTIKLGEKTFSVVGPTDFNPGGSQRDAFIASPVFIPLSDLESTGLLREGGLVDYTVHLLLPKELGGHVPDEIDLYAKQKDLRLSTTEKRTEFLGRIADSVKNYFSLFGLSILLIAALGSSAAILFYLQSKQSSAAILRCLGVSPRSVTAIFTMQVLGAGLSAGAVGSVLGVFLYRMIYASLSNFSEVTYEFQVYLQPLLWGIGVCLTVIAVTALPALFGIARVAPVLVFRRNETTGKKLSRPLIWGLTLLSLLGFAVGSGVPLKTAASYTLGLSIILIVFVLAARALQLLAQRASRLTLPFSLRYGLRNLYKPRNQTIELLMVLGVSILLVNLVVLVQRIVDQQIALSMNPDRPNVFIFDVQSDQISSVEGLFAGLHLPSMRQEPIVLMRLAKLKSRDVEAIASDPSNAIDGWALRREYWVSYRDHLVSSEKITGGEFTANVSPGTERIPISVDKRLAETLGLKLGDEIEFSLQGTPIYTYIGSLREIFWQQMERNSFVIFPKGSLDDVPQSAFMATKTDSSGLQALRKSITATLPNISVLDLQSIITRLNTVLSAIRQILQLLAGLMGFTAVLVIISTLVSSRTERGYEIAILKTLGATRRQLLTVNFVEYGVLGLFSGISAVAMSMAAGEFLRTSVFELERAGSLSIILIGLLCVVVQTSFCGLFDEPNSKYLNAYGDRQVSNVC